MKKLLLFGVVCIFAYSTVAFSQTTTVWQQSVATNNLPSWFNTNSEQRSMAYGNVGGNDQLYLTYAGRALGPVLVLDAATGDSVGTLDTTGISGGTFPLDDIGVSSDGLIFAADLTVNAQSSPFKVYEWSSDSAAPKPIITYADSAYRLGDHITVTGSASDNSLTIWAAASGKDAVVRFTTTDYGATFTPQVIELQDSVTTGTIPKVYPAGSDFFVSSAGVGIREYDATGKLLGAVASLPINIGNMAYISGGSPMKAYVFAYDYTNVTGVTPQYVRIVDVTNGVASADSVGATPVLGSALNANGTGAIALKDNGDGTVTIFVLATNNGIGAFSFKAWQVAQSQSVATLWQESSATGNLPSWFSTNNEQRNFAYVNSGGKGHLYLTYAGHSLEPILILDAATGDSIGTIDTAGISGGTFPLDDIEASSDGVIFAGNLTVNAKSTPFKVYEWTSETAVPKAVISYADSSYRLGDHMTVTGSTADNTVTIWVAATGGNALVKFTTKDYGATFTPTVIPLSSGVGSTPKVWPTANGDFFVSSAGQGINEYDSSGKLLGTVASLPTSIGDMAYISGGSPMKDYIFAYNYTNIQGVTPQYVQIADVTNGISSADTVASTPVLGTTVNGNGTGDIALKDNGDGTVTIFVLATNNGIGAFTFKAWQVAQPQYMPTVWQQSIATSNLPSWFNTNNEQRNMAYGNVGGNEHLYVTYGAGAPAPVLILNAATGDSIGTLDTAGISGGTFPLDDIGVSSDGMIFAADLTVNAKSSPFKVYEWTSQSAAPKAVITYADSAYRLGDHITVSGSASDNSLTIWAAASGKDAVVKFTTTDYGATFTPHVIALQDSVKTGTIPKVYPAGNDFLVSSAGVGIREYDASGKLLGAVASLPTSIGDMAYVSGGSPMKAYVFAYNYTNVQGVTPQYVEALDVTNGISTADSITATPDLGTALNVNGTGAIALKQNSDGSVTVFVLATNNGIGAFTFNAQLTAVQSRSNGTPSSYVLSQNYPNPFNPTTQIDYSVPKSGLVTLKVYNVLGQEVATLFSGRLQAGRYTATFNASQYASGVYFYRLQAGNFSIVKKMVLVK